MKKIICLALMLSCAGHRVIAQELTHIPDEAQPKVQVPACQSLQALQWLLGDWISSEGKNITTESWTKVSEYSFEGRGQSKAKSDNVLKSHESLRLVNMENEIFFIAKVKHNLYPVAFKLSQCTDRTATFENANHDFPKKLVYQLTDNNGLTVLVSDGHTSGFSVHFVRQTR